jgi:hypothetical protein
MSKKGDRYAKDARVRQKNEERAERWWRDQQAKKRKVDRLSVKNK